MKKILMRLLRTPVIALLCVPVIVYAASSVITVNGQPLKQSWVDVIMLDAQGSSQKPNEKAIQSFLLRNELLAQEAIRLGIDKRPDFVAREEIRHRELLATLLLKDASKNYTISEDMLKAEYESFKKSAGDKEYSARHIQVQTEAEAKEVIAKLAKGADFAKLAQEKSTDLGSKDKGGDLGWFSKNAITPPLGDAASKLQKGLFTTVPLQSGAGWHVLKLEDVRDAQPPAYDKVKEQMRNRLKNQQTAKLIDGLRSKAKIEGIK